MIFSGLPFMLFFAALVAFMLMVKGTRTKKLMLLGASLLFYAYWDVRFIPLLLFLAGFNFFIAKRISKLQHEGKKAVNALVISIAVNLSVLGYFKYMNFFIDNVDRVLSLAGFQLGNINIVLPLGISFFIFEFISYNYDIYKNKIVFPGDLLDFLVFVFFFPRLASGPIVRPADFLPQLKNEVVIKPSNAAIGLQIFVRGLFKKVVMADNLAPFADKVFSAPQIFDTPTVWMSVIAYAIQIFCDFSGYSDMAIGISKILGFELPVNFNMPYISRSVTEFWKRWHISLSSWLRDYLYIPLGGNRRGKLRTDINLLVTMLLGGLWHGASWTFVFWGGLQGIALIVHKHFLKLKDKLGIRINRHVGNMAAWLTTIAFTCVSWVLFRAESFDKAFIMIRKMFAIDSGVHWIYTPLLYLALPVIVAGTIIGWMKRNTPYAAFDLKKPIPAFILIFSLFGIIFLSATNDSPFIYFQF